VFTPLNRAWGLSFLGIMLLAPAANSLCAATNSSWYARSWQTDEGLPDNIVAGVAQSKDGYLWVATHAGLASFDGIRFREFAAASGEGASSSLIQAMLLDRRGRLWLAKNEGVVVCIDAGQTQMFRPEGGLPIIQRARDMAE